jgi:hypothetical protein
MSGNTTTSSNKPLRDLTGTTDDGKIELTERELNRVSGSGIYLKWAAVKVAFVSK